MKDILSGVAAVLFIIVGLVVTIAKDYILRDIRFNMKKKQCSKENCENCQCSKEDCCGGDCQCSKK